MWKFVDDSTPLQPYTKCRVFSSKTDIGIDKYSLDGIFIQHYNTLKSASTSVGLKTGSPRIIACCKGERENYKNYIWKYSN